jgi:hypothetical protein
MRYVSLKTSAIALMMSSVVASPMLAHAADSTKPPPESSAAAGAGPDANNMQQFAGAGHSVMVDIDDARLAIFNGDPKVAMKLMEAAKSSLVQADKDVHSVNESAPVDKAKPDSTNMVGPKMRSLQVDGQLALADDFVMTPEKKAHVDKANESFKKGNRATGLEELRLGAIDVNYTRWWLPIETTENHLDQAIKLANESKYYQANLALKAIDDSVTIDSISFSDLPMRAKPTHSAS